MLHDRDRIFTNLYGQDDWGLEGARRRGVWDGTKKLIELGRDTVVQLVKERRPSVLSCRQRGRIRAWILQGSRDLTERPSQIAGRLSGGRLRYGGRHLLHLYPRRILL
jgi:hypothetical protein